MHARLGHRADEIVGRLLREAQALARLQHPNVVAIYDANRIGELVYSTMEAGRRLEPVALAQGRQAERVMEILDTFVAAGRGLAAAHKAGIVHRDFCAGQRAGRPRRPRARGRLRHRPRRRRARVHDCPSGHVRKYIDTAEPAPSRRACRRSQPYQVYVR